MSADLFSPDLKMKNRTVILFFLLWARIESGYAQQLYDPTDCTSDVYQNGSRYTCNSNQTHCDTFIVYRASLDFQTISSISELFGVDSDDLLQLNDQASPEEVLKLGKEIIVPVKCSCAGPFYQANVSYPVGDVTALSDVACGIFEGLVKSKTLSDEYPSTETNHKINSTLQVPIKCACPDRSSSSSKFKYLVAYPLIPGDEPKNMAILFGIPSEDIYETNGLDRFATVYPGTTILIPLRNKPAINSTLTDIPPSPSTFVATVTNQRAKISSKIRSIFIAGSIVGFFVAASSIVACVLYATTMNKWKHQKFRSLTARSSPGSCCLTPRGSPRSCVTARSSATTPCLSPDLLASIKFSLHNYSMGDLNRATENFSEQAKLDYPHVFKGLLDNQVQVMIKQMRFEDTRKIIDLHAKINHINVVQLHGACYGESDISEWSYLVFEFPANGCLRDCLRKTSVPLEWKKRTQLAFDIANGLHYLHYCTFPSYNHISIDSRNIFITTDWRAKLTTFRTSPSASSSKEIATMASDNQWLAPEFIQHGSVTEKADIFALGVVLIELISGKEDSDGSIFRESVAFLAGGASDGGCFEQLRIFIDSRLNGAYPLAEALCLAVLAKACVEDDPLHRPSMDDILKVLARMV